MKTTYAIEQYKATYTYIQHMYIQHTIHIIPPHNTTIQYHTTATIIITYLHNKTIHVTPPPRPTNNTSPSQKLHQAIGFDGDGEPKRQLGQHIHQKYSINNLCQLSYFLILGQQLHQNHRFCTPPGLEQ